MRAFVSVTVVMTAIAAACGLAQATQLVSTVPRLDGVHERPAPSQRFWKIGAQPVSAAYSLGEPVFFDLQVTNLRSKPAAIDLGADDKMGLRITTTEPNGLARPVRLRLGGIHAIGKHLVGAHATYTRRLILNEWNDFREVGDYYATVELVSEFGPSPNDPPTTNFHVRIGPRDESKLSAVANVLADRAVNGKGVRERMDASFALSWVDDPVAIPEMARVLASGNDEGTLLITTLAHLGGPSAIEALQAAAKNHPDPAIRLIADRTLRTLRTGERIPLHYAIAD